MVDEGERPLVGGPDPLLVPEPHEGALEVREPEARRGAQRRACDLGAPAIEAPLLEDLRQPLVQPGRAGAAAEALDEGVAQLVAEHSIEPRVDPLGSDRHADRPVEHAARPVTEPGQAREVLRPVEHDAQAALLEREGAEQLAEVLVRTIEALEEVGLGVAQLAVVPVVGELEARVAAREEPVLVGGLAAPALEARLHRRALLAVQIGQRALEQSHRTSAVVRVRGVDQGVRQGRPRHGEVAAEDCLCRIELAALLEQLDRLPQLLRVLSLEEVEGGPVRGESTRASRRLVRADRGLLRLLRGRARRGGGPDARRGLGLLDGREERRRGRARRRL